MIRPIAPASEETAGPSQIALELIQSVLAVRLLQFKDNERIGAGVVGEYCDVGPLFFLVGSNLHRPFDADSIQVIAKRVLNVTEKKLADDFFGLCPQPFGPLRAEDFDFSGVVPLELQFVPLAFAEERKAMLDPVVPKHFVQ